MDELEVAVAKELKEAREQKALYEALINHRGWDMFKVLIEAQIESRTREVMSSPLGDEKTLAKQEWDKGEASGLRLALALPRIIIENLESIEKENAPDVGADDPSDDSADNTGTSERDFDASRDFDG